MTEQNLWKKCTTCKTAISYGDKYLVCNVSTCNTKRAAMFFCSIRCFDAHVPVMRHKDCYYKELKAPKDHQDELRLIEEQKSKSKKETETKVEAPQSTRNVIVRKKTS